MSDPTIAISIVFIAASAFVIATLLQRSEKMAAHRLTLAQLFALVFVIMLGIEILMRRAGSEAYSVWFTVRNMFGGMGMGWFLMYLMNERGNDGR